jgi:hypothetical protein
VYLKSEKTDAKITFYEEKILNKRIDSFRKIFEGNNSLEQFDPIAFESIVEKVIVGGMGGNQSIGSDSVRERTGSITSFRDRTG